MPLPQHQQILQLRSGAQCNVGSFRRYIKQQNTNISNSQWGGALRLHTSQPTPTHSAANFSPAEGIKNGPTSFKQKGLTLQPLGFAAADARTLKYSQGEIQAAGISVIRLSHSLLTSWCLSSSDRRLLAKGNCQQHHQASLGSKSLSGEHLSFGRSDKSLRGPLVHLLASTPQIGSLVLCLLFSHSVVSNSLLPRGLQYPRFPCLSLSPRACSNSCPLSR